MGRTLPPGGTHEWCWWQGPSDQSLSETRVVVGLESPRLGHCVVCEPLQARARDFLVFPRLLLSQQPRDKVWVNFCVDGVVGS